jgi:flagellar hook-associated protein 3 FlgL
MLERTSTLSLNNMLQTSNRRLQVALLKAQTELTTGRHADVGLQLGTLTSRNLRWRTEIATLTSAIERNEIYVGHAEVSQSAIEAIKSQASYLRETALGARSAPNGKDLVLAAGKNALESVIDAISTNYAGEHIFSGLAADVEPLSRYDGFLPQTAFDLAFQTEFGFAKDSPLASGISASQLQQFVDGAFQSLFEEPAWSTNWSSADSVNQLARIDRTTTVDLDANANETAFRKVLSAAVVLREMGGTAIGQGALQVVTDSATKKLSEGIQELGEIQARIGHGQQALRLATERMSAKISKLETVVGKTEGVSQYDAAARVNALMTQLESSYAVTGRISRLSLLSYL